MQAERIEQSVSLTFTLDELKALHWALGIVGVRGVLEDEEHRKAFFSAQATVWAAHVNRVVMA